MPATNLFQWFDRTGATRVDRRYVQGGATVQFGEDAVATVGTPVTYFERAGDGRDFPGIALIEFDNVDVASPTHTADVTINFFGGLHPGEARTLTGVVCDGTTPCTTLWDGYVLKFTSSASLANGWKAGLFGGLFPPGALRAGNPNGVQWNEETGLYTPGWTDVSPGDPGAKWVVMVKNAGASTAAECHLKHYPSLVPVIKTSPKIFEWVQAVGDALDPDTYVGGGLRPYKFRVQSRASGPPGGTGTLQISEDPWTSWNTFNVRNISTGVDGTSTGLAFDGTTSYVATSGPAADMLFALSTLAANTSVENSTIIDPAKYFWMGLDAEPEEFVQDDLPISEEGREDLVFTPSGARLVSLYFDVDALASKDQNPFVAQLQMEYSFIGAGGYDD